MPGIDVIAGLAFIAAFVVISVATADAAGIEQRVRRRGRIGESAQAIRDVQEVVDFARGGYLGVVCTPSRRVFHVGGDLEGEAPPPQALPDPLAAARHLAPRGRRRRTRLVRGIRALFAPSASLSPPAERTAPATRRPRADSR